MHTSPHLLRFNERCVIAGNEVDDETLIEAFKEVDKARGETPLTYFEFMLTVHPTLGRKLPSRHLASFPT